MGISCKRNNGSVKHQRPRALIQQMSLAISIETEYKAEYDKLVKQFYDECTEAKRTMFNKVGGAKTKLYADINALVCKYIHSAPDENKLALVKFILSASESNMVVLHYNDKKKALRLLKLQTSLETIDSFSIQSVSSNTLQITCNNVKLSLRIHNAKKDITPSVSLKYDSKVLNYDEVFKVVG
jgi:hypothetical protein